MKPKIIIVTEAWNQTNGVVTTFENIIKYLKGYEIEIVHPGLFKSFSVPGYKEIKIVYNGWNIISKYLDKADYIHIATEGPLGWAARNYCIKKGWKFTTSYHTNFPEFLKKLYYIPTWLTKPILRKFHNKSSLVLVPSLSAKTNLEKQKYKNIKVWTRGFDQKIFNPNQYDYEIHNKIKSFAKGEQVLLNVGRVSYEKGLKDFLDLPGKKVLVGTGPALYKFQKHYKDVLYLGELKGKELGAVYTASDIFVFPSKVDTFGVVMLEAMACGLPVIAYPVPGPKDVVRHKHSGWLSEDLNDALNNVHKIKKNNVLEHSSNFNWIKCAKIFDQSIIKKQ